MQTFLPWPNARRSVACLDMKRLGKQRVETLQIMTALCGGVGLSGGWSKHPASRMWRGYEKALLSYQRATCREWATVRGYRDTCWTKTLAVYREAHDDLDDPRVELPWWWGSIGFHARHRSNLLRKAPEYYRSVFRGSDLVRDDLAYLWPDNARHVLVLGTIVSEDDPLVGRVEGLDTVDKSA